jgi:Ca2+-binding EF-hand superfamily protein
MSSKNNGELTVTFTAEKIERLKNARALFESDTNKSIELDAFVDMLVETYLSYRNLRGAKESSLLQKLAGKP